MIMITFNTDDMDKFNSKLLSLIKLLLAIKFTFPGGDKMIIDMVTKTVGLMVAKYQINMDNESRQ